ncbi:MAG: SAF domain-containing protein [Planctomycetota bacterium]
MRRKRAIVYLVAGLVCASVSVFAAYRYVSGVGAGGGNMPRTKLLVAMRDIPQGEVLRPQQDGEGNVGFVKWPAHAVPQGALRTEKQLTEEGLRARTDLFKHEVVQEARVVAEDQFVPEDMYLQMVKVKEEELESGRLRLGMKVDVLRVTDQGPEEFMKCVEIFAVGRLDENGLPKVEEDPPPNVWLLVNKKDRSAFVQADYQGNLLLVETEDPTGPGPRLVDGRNSEKQRRREAAEKLQQARSLAKAGEHERALEVVKALEAGYPDVGDVVGQAAVAAANWRKELAQKLYDRARIALEGEEDFSEALKLLERIEREFPSAPEVLEQARRLRSRASDALERHRAEVQFQSAMDDVDAALRSGELPRAEQRLDEMSRLSEKSIDVDDRYDNAEEAFTAYARRVKKAGSDFRIMKQALELFLKRGDLEAAREKITQIKDDFPQHPEIAELEKKVEAAGQPSES